MGGRRGVPEVGGGVFVRDEEDGERAVVGIGHGEDAVGAAGVVFHGVGAEAFEKGGAAEGVRWLERGLGQGEGGNAYIRSVCWLSSVCDCTADACYLPLVEHAYFI